MSFDLQRITEQFRRPLSVYTEREDSLRHATWLELFFDLVFVVAIAELGTNLHHNMTVEGLLYFTGVFVLVWWIWLDYSYYADLYAADDLLSRLSLIGVMFVVIFLSQTVDGVFHGQTFVFGVTMLLLRVVLTILYLRPRPHVTDSETSGFVLTWVTSEVLTTTIWAVSLFVPDPGRFGLWLAAFTINMAGVAVMYTVFDTVLVQVSHFPERLGLITIIVLGETVLAVSFGTSIATSGPDFRLGALLVGLFGFLIAVGAWWLYFGHFDERVIDRALTAPPDRRIQARQAALVYVFSHFFVHVGIVAAGVGIAIAIEATSAGEPLGDGSRLVLCGGLAVFLFGCAVLQRALVQVREDTRFDNHVLAGRLFVVLAFLGLVVGGGAISPPELAAVVALAFVALVGYESVVASQAEPSRTAVES